METTITEVFHYTANDGRKSTKLSFEPAKDANGVWVIKDDKWFAGHLEMCVGDKVRF